MGTKSLKPLELQRFVRRLDEEVKQLKDPSYTYFALSDLAKAQARLGDIQSARKSALAIGAGRSLMKGAQNMTDGQPYALLCVAIAELKAGDDPGARETLRLGYESVQRHPSMRGDSGRLQQVARGQVAAGDMEGVLRSANAIERGEKSEILAWIAWAQAVTGPSEPARETMKAALEDAGLDPANGRVIRPT